MSKFRIFSVLYVIGLHVLCAIILVNSDFLEKLGVSLPSELSSYFTRITNYHERMDGSVPEGATIFIGDSITQGLATSAISDLSVNYGIGSDTTAGVIQRLPLYKSISTAKAVVIAIGVNDLRRRSNSEIVDNYSNILDFFPKDKSIIVSGVLPVDEEVNGVSVSNERIIVLNSGINHLASSYKNVTFINPGEALTDEDNNLKPEFHIGDGVHLNTDGYQIWINLLKVALNKT